MFLWVLDILWCQRHIHEYYWLSDHLEIKWAMYCIFRYMQDGGLGDDVFFPFLTQVYFYFGIELGDIKRVGPVKMEKLVEIVGVGVLHHDMRFRYAVPEDGKVLLADFRVLAAKKY